MIPIILNRVYFSSLSDNFTSYIEVFFLFKCHTIFELTRKIDYTFGNKEKWENIVEFVKMLMFVLICAHFMAICYHSIA